MTPRRSRPATQGRARPITLRRTPRRPRRGGPITLRRTARRTARRGASKPRRQPLPGAYWVIVGAVAALCGIGLVFVLSATSVMAARSGSSSWYYFGRQAVWLALGLMAALIVSRIDYRRIVRLGPVAMVGTLVLLVLVLAPTPMRKEVNGSRRWLGWGQIVIQPSELAKIALVLFLAHLLGRRRRLVADPVFTIVPAMLVTCAASALVLAEPDLGTAVLLTTIAVMMLVVSGSRLNWIAGVSVSLASIGLVFTTWGYRRQRMLAFTDPWRYRDGPGYQTLQSQVGLATGGLFGVGLGNSRAKWGFLPEAHTDFIFAIIGEELGLVGCLVVMALFGVLIAAGSVVAVRAPDIAGTLVAAGVTAWIGCQAAINIGVSVGVAPNKGMTLPLVSYGGSSLTVTLAAVGLLLSVARRSRPRPAPATTSRSVVRAGSGETTRRVGAAVGVERNG